MSGRLRPAVREALSPHGITPEPDETLESLRERLNDAYLDEVRQLKGRQKAGEIPLREYAGHVEALKARYSLLGVPLRLWTEPPPQG